MNIEYTYMFLAIGLLFFVLYKVGAFAFFGKAIDDRNKKIDDDVKEAARIRKEAEDLYKQAEKDLNEAKQTSEDIVANAQQQADGFAKEQEQKLEEELARKIQLAEERIELAEKSAKDEVSQKAVDAAIKAAEDMIKNKMTKGQLDDILDQSLVKVKSTKLH